MKVICIQVPVGPPSDTNFPKLVIGDEYVVVDIIPKGMGVMLNLNSLYVLPWDYYMLEGFAPSYMFASICFIPAEDNQLSNLTVDELLRQVSAPVLK